MDDAPQQPLLFANRLIRQLIDHLLGVEVVALPVDLTTIRTAYRAAGGSWEAILLGDIVHTRLLEELVIAWGKQPHRIRDSEV